MLTHEPAQVAHRSSMPRLTPPEADPHRRDRQQQRRQRHQCRHQETRVAPPPARRPTATVVGRPGVGVTQHAAAAWCGEGKRLWLVKAGDLATTLTSQRYCWYQRGAWLTVFI